MSLTEHQYIVSWVVGIKSTVFRNVEELGVMGMGNSKDGKRVEKLLLSMTVEDPLQLCRNAVL